MFQSHSSIIPPGYASTREVSDYMVKKLGGRLRKGRRSRARACVSGAPSSVSGPAVTRPPRSDGTMPHVTRHGGHSTRWR